MIGTSRLSTRVGLDLTLRAYFDANRLSGPFVILANLPFFEHAERIVRGGPRIDFAKITSFFQRYGILKELTEISARGVCALRERDDFSALRALLLKD